MVTVQKVTRWWPVAREERAQTRPFNLIRLAIARTLWLHQPGCTVAVYCAGASQGRESHPPGQKCTCELVTTEFMTRKQNNEINTGFYLMVFKFCLKCILRCKSIYWVLQQSCLVQNDWWCCDLSEMEWFLYVCKCFYFFSFVCSHRSNEDLLRVPCLNPFLPSDKHYHRP